MNRFLWRCNHCRPARRKDDDARFAAGKGPHGVGVCPHCGAGGSPRTARAVVRLVPVHFELPAGPGGDAAVALACGWPPAGLVRSGSPRATTCPACLGSDAHAAALEGADADPAYLVPDAAKRAVPRGEPKKGKGDDSAA